MRWFNNLFMNSYQRALVDPKLYTAPMPAADVRAELETVRDYESRNYMQSALTDATDKAGNVTLKTVVDQLDGVKGALRFELDRHMHECGTILALGGSMLASHLLARANRIASEIQPGAKDALKDVLG